MYLPRHFRQDFHYLSLHSSLLEELSLLYGLPLGGTKGQAGRIRRCRRMARDLLTACRQQPDQPDYPYLLGVLLERAGQWPLTSRPRWAYEQAERCYDRARQLQAMQPSGTYDRQRYLRPSVALLRLSLRQRQEERFCLVGPMRRPAPLPSRCTGPVPGALAHRQGRLWTGGFYPSESAGPGRQAECFFAGPGPDPLGYRHGGLSGTGDGFAGDLCPLYPPGPVGCPFSCQAATNGGLRVIMTGIGIFAGK